MMASAVCCALQCFTPIICMLALRRAHRLSEHTQMPPPRLSQHPSLRPMPAQHHLQPGVAGAHHEAQSSPAVWQQDGRVSQRRVVQVVEGSVRGVPDALTHAQQPEVVTVQVKGMHLCRYPAGSQSGPPVGIMLLQMPQVLQCRVQAHTVLSFTELACAKQAQQALL